MVPLFFINTFLTGVYNNIQYNGLMIQSLGRTGGRGDGTCVAMTIRF